MAHSRSWSNANPAGSALANTLDTLGQQLRQDIDERMSLDHYWGDSTDDTADGGDGHHRPGRVAVLHKGDTASFGTLGGTITTGCIGWDSQIGVLKRYNGSSWEDAGPLGGGDSFYFYASSDITGQTNLEIITDFDTSQWNVLNSFNSSTGLFTCKNSGIYAVFARLERDNAGNNQFYAVCAKNQTTTFTGADAVIYGSQSRNDAVTGDNGSVLAGLTKLTSGDTIGIGFDGDGVGSGVTIDAANIGQCYFAAHYLGPS